ncbi:MAG: hypothetical protein GQF41_3789 [Candidatus Rifleibacterium amylolyticum]|nr:MAG: hypothetical protein GQF41_3789 [Candidatus Rifleibacterium amylolyticum]
MVPKHCQKNLYDAVFNFCHFLVSFLRFLCLRINFLNFENFLSIIFYR